MSSTDKTKLDGIETGATVNSTDATLLARANHTGTQAWSTITATPTTLSGYGITDGLTSATAATTYQPLTANLTALGANDAAYYLSRANHTGTQASTTITGLGTAATLNTGTASNTVATGDDSRFGSTATTLTVASNATTLDASQGTRRVYLLTITSTSAFTFTLSNLPTGANWWEAEVIITTTAVPASFTFAGSSTKVDVTNSTLTNNPFATGRITSMLLSKQKDGRYTAQFSPAQLAA
jgi:hypothetical protein